MRQSFQEIARFGIVGIISTITNYGVYCLLLSLFNPSFSFFIGYVAAFIVNYILTTSFTFKVKATKKNAGGFIFSNIINFLLCELVLNAFISLGLSKQWAPIPMYVLCVPVNFIIVRSLMKRL